MIFSSVVDAHILQEEVWSDDRQDDELRRRRVSSSSVLVREILCFRPCEIPDSAYRYSNVPLIPFSGTLASSYLICLPAYRYRPLLSYALQHPLPADGQLQNDMFVSTTAPDPCLISRLYDRSRTLQTREAYLPFLSHFGGRLSQSLLPSAPLFVTSTGVFSSQQMKRDDSERPLSLSA